MYGASRDDKASGVCASGTGERSSAWTGGPRDRGDRHQAAWPCLRPLKVGSGGAHLVVSAERRSASKLSLAEPLNVVRIILRMGGQQSTYMTRATTLTSRVVSEWEYTVDTLDGQDT